MSPRLWAQLRAAFVTFHVLAVVGGSIPAPVGGLHRSSWSDPTVAAELEGWRSRLGAIGLQLDRKTYEDGLFTFARGLLRARAVALAPFQPYYRYVGVEQGWRMFVAPQTHPARLEIEVQEGGAWRSVYLQLDPERRWRADQLESGRFRSALFRYAWKHYRRQHRQLARWIARQAEADFPQAAAVRVRWVRGRTPSPAEARAGTRPPVRTTDEIELALPLTE
jgi:hypothetical protein